VKLNVGRDGSLQVSLEAAEVDLLREVPRQLRLLYEADVDDPARARLFPTAYLDPTEEAAEQQWRARVHPELLRERLEGLNRLFATLERGSPRGRRIRVDLTPEDVQVWLSVLNDARLAFGSRLGVSDDTDVYEITPADPLGPEKEAYAWLTSLQGVMVDALLGTMPR
jgi:hypothetical protein